MFGKALYYKSLGFTGSVAQSVEQRPFKPKYHLVAFSENPVFPHTSNESLCSSEDQTKIKSTSLARTWRALMAMKLARSVLLLLKLSIKL